MAESPRAADARPLREPSFRRSVSINCMRLRVYTKFEVLNNPLTGSIAPRDLLLPREGCVEVKCALRDVVRPYCTELHHKRKRIETARSTQLQGRLRTHPDKDASAHVAARTRDAEYRAPVELPKHPFICCLPYTKLQQYAVPTSERQPACADAHGQR